MAKYNSEKVEINGIKFDSKLESQYYLHLLEQRKNGHIQDYQLQPTFTLQDGFKRSNKAILPIKYKADFLVIHNDGTNEIIDVKGFETTDFKIKKKLFMFKYPHLKLSLITYVKKYGGWIELEELKRLRKVKK